MPQRQTRPTLRWNYGAWMCGVFRPLCVKRCLAVRPQPPGVGLRRASLLRVLLWRARVEGLELSPALVRYFVGLEGSLSSPLSHRYSRGVLAIVRQRGEASCSSS